MIPVPAARFLSYILHPLLMPFYAVLIIMQLNTYISYSISPQVQKIIISLVFITTCALPVVTALILLQKGYIKSLEMETLNERKIPFLSTALFYFMCYYLLHQLPVPRILGLMVMGAAMTIVIAWILSFQWKVSIHMIGIGGLTGMLLGLSQVLNAGLTEVILASILISGFLGSARLILKAHNPNQVYVGFPIGFVTEWLVIIGLSA